MDEKPLPVEAINVDLQLPAGVAAGKVRMATPENDALVELPAALKDGRLRFTVPRFLVYAIARVELQ